MNTITAIADQTASVLSEVNPDQFPPQPKVNGLTTRNVSDLNPYDRNSRTHSEAQIAQIAASIKEFGFTNPVLIDEHDTIIAGHARVLAADKQNLTEVPCVVLAGLTEAQKAAYVIADNKLALNAGWDEEMLEAEFDRLAKMQYDLNLTGFSEVEIAKLLADIGASFEDLASELDAQQSEVGQPGADEHEPKRGETDESEPDARDSWQGMPEFDQPAAEPFRTIKVHFKQQAAVDAFAALISQKLTEKTKSVWYPRVVKAAAGVVYG
jgi:ParB-like chromosome segregation protein Spo0J